MEIENRTYTEEKIMARLVIKNESSHGVEIPSKYAPIVRGAKMIYPGYRMVHEFPADFAERRLLCSAFIKEFGGKLNIKATCGGLKWV